MVNDMDLLNGNSALDNKTIDKLKYDLVRDGLISYEDFEKAQEIANSQNVNIGQALINSGLIDEPKLLHFLELKLHIPYVDLDDYSLDSRCLKYIHLTDAKKYKMIPLFKIEDELTIAMADPLNLLAIDNVVEDEGFSIAPVISSEKSILKKIEEYYNTENTLDVITTDKNKGYLRYPQLFNRLLKSCLKCTFFHFST